MPFPPLHRDPKVSPHARLTLEPATDLTMFITVSELNLRFYDPQQAAAFNDIQNLMRNVSSTMSPSAIQVDSLTKYLTLVRWEVLNEDAPGLSHIIRRVLLRMRVAVLSEC